MLGTLIKIRLQGIFVRSMKGSKKKNAGIGKMIFMGLLFLYLAVVLFGVFGYLFSSILKPFIAIQYEWLYFALMAIMVIMFCFFGSVFMTQQEIYGAKDNDMLLSMPILPRDILLNRIFVILILNYIYEFIVGLPCIFIYFKNTPFDLVKLLFFIVIMLTLPLFVLALSCVFGWVMAMIMGRMKHKTWLTLLLSLGFLGAYFYVITEFQKYLNLLIMHGKSLGDGIRKTLFPIYHLAMAMSEKNVVSLLIYLVCAIIPFAIVIFLLSKNFVGITTSKANVKKVKLKESDIQFNSLKVALLKREWSHFASSPSVILNTSLGIVFTIVMAVALLIKGEDLLFMLGSIPKEAKGMIEGFKMPILCLAVIALNSLDTISASTISLEGNRLWILKTLPVKTEDILKTKLIFYLILCLPTSILCSVIGSILLSFSIEDAIVAVIAPVCFLVFQGLAGLLLNLWKPKFDWVNETVVVKQSMSVMIMMFGFMALVMGIVILYVGVCMNFMSPTIYTYLWTGVLAVGSVILYYCLKTWGTRRFESL